MAQEQNMIFEHSPNGIDWTAVTLPAGSTEHTLTGLAAGTTRYGRWKAKGNGTTTSDSDYTPVKSATTGQLTYDYGSLTQPKIILDYSGLATGQDNAYGVVDAQGNVTKLRSIAPGIIREFNLAGSGLVLTTEGVVFSGTGNFTNTDLAAWVFLHQPNAKYTITTVAKFGTVPNPDVIYGVFGTNGGTAGKTGIYYAYDDRAAMSRNESLATFITNSNGSSTAVPLSMKSSESAPPPNTFGVMTQTVDMGATIKGRFWHNGVEKVSQAAIFTANAVSGNPTHGLDIGAVGNGSLKAVMVLKQLIINEAIEPDATIIGFDNWLKGRAGL